MYHVCVVLWSSSDFEDEDEDDGFEGVRTTSTPRFLATATTVLRVPKSTPVEGERGQPKYFQHQYSTTTVEAAQQEQER